MQSTLLKKLSHKKGPAPRHAEGGCACGAPQAHGAQPAVSHGGPVAGGFPLMLAGCGRPVQVQQVRGAADTVQFLKSLGFVEGSDITVVCENGGNLIVDVKGARVAVARQMASKIMVKGRN